MCQVMLMECMAYKIHFDGCHTQDEGGIKAEPSESLGKAWFNLRAGVQSVSCRGCSEEVPVANLSPKCSILLSVASKLQEKKRSISTVVMDESQ